MLTTLKDCENPVKHLVETAGKVRCQKSQHKIPVLLKQRIFMPVAPVGVRITQVLFSIYFDSYP